MAPRNRKVKNSDGTWSKKPFKQQTLKRKHLEDADGWTHVVGPHQNKIRETVDTDVVHIDRSTDEMLAQHEKTLKRWQEDDVRKTLITAIEEFEKTLNAKIKKIVCLGLGTLSNGNFTQQNDRHAQLAALMDMVGLLGGLEHLQLIAQDPVFGPCDKSFLNSLGFKVVESPGGFESVDEDTLVYAVHCHEEIYEEISKMTRPAIMIGNDLEQLSDLRDAPGWMKSLAGDYDETSVETVLLKRKDRHDSFHQIFCSAFYATRLYLRRSSTPHDLLKRSLMKEGPSSQARGILVPLESHVLEDSDASEDNLEMDSKEESPCPEVTRPVADENETFDIFDELNNLVLETKQPVSEMPPSDLTRGDPIEDKENLPPLPSEPAYENPTAENHENPMNVEMAEESIPVNKRSSVHNWLPGLHSSVLPTFQHKGFAFIFGQNAPEDSPPSIASNL